MTKKKSERLKALTVREAFVADYLSPLVQAANPSVIAVKYIADDSGEFVRLGYGNGFIANVNVTADSLNALAADVLRYTARH